MLNRTTGGLFLLLALVFPGQAVASTLYDDFTQPIDINSDTKLPNPWIALGSPVACLTAGSSTVSSGSSAYNPYSASTNPIGIPGCNFTTPDAAGSGALRLTPSQGSAHGAIVYNTAFTSSQGLQVTFTTYSWGGSKDGPAGEGADGISFFLIDPTQVPSSLSTSSNLGSWGGSLAYSCSNVNPPYVGLAGAYLGLGMDEYGNFLNGWDGSNYNDNTHSAIAIQPTSGSCTNGCNSATSGTSQQANRIGLRGAGNVNWNWLNANYPYYYPSSLSSSNQQTAVQQTCETGTLWDYSGVTSSQSFNISSASASGTTLTVTTATNGSFAAGDSVALTGISASYGSAQNITSASVSGTTLTIGVPSVAGYTANSTSVTFGGTITLTNSSTASQSITSISSYSTSNTTCSSAAPCIRLYMSNPSVFSAGESVTVSGVSGGSSGDAALVNGTHTIINGGVHSSYIIISIGSGFNTSSYPSGGTVSYTTTSTSNVTGAYTVQSVNTSNNTFTVTVSSSTSVTYSNATAQIASTPLCTTSPYCTIASVTNSSSSSTFTINSIVPSGASSIVNNSGTAVDKSGSSSARNLSVTSSGGPTLYDYQTIGCYTVNGTQQCGYYVLPTTSACSNTTSGLLAKESATSRTCPITYKLQITPNGLLNFFFSYNGGDYHTVLNGWPLTTNNPSNNTNSNGLPTSFLFGFAGSTGGSWNEHDITCFLAEPMESSSSASANTVQAGQVRTTTEVYLASYNPNTVSGSLVAEALVVNSNGSVSTNSAADWDASCVLTGTCSTTYNTAGGYSAPTAAEPPGDGTATSTSRQILTWNGTQGVSFQWTNLTSSQVSTLNSSDSNGQFRLNWLRGDRSEEQTASPAGPLRVRASVLGDIIDSSPVWVGPPSASFGSSFYDSLYGSTVTPPETSYATYAADLVTRLNMVYVGANDGMLHGFRAGSYQSDGTTYVSSTNDGYEMIGFVPSTVLANGNVVSLTNPSYSHYYFDDATPGTGDLFYNNQWHTWLVSGLGAGGNEIFALDISDPTGAATGTYSSSTTPFSESGTDPSKLVIGDWTSSTITCQLVSGTAVSSCGNNLGQTYGTPIIRRMHNGQWAIIFGNGLNSTNGYGGIFIGLIPTNFPSGAITFYWFQTGTATANGIEYVSSADLDGDHIADYLYAGDLLGNVWRFDVTSRNIADWGVSKFGNSSATPLFTAKNGTGGTAAVQPITTRIAVTATTVGTMSSSSATSQRLLLGFGTGDAIPPSSLTQNDTYSTVTPQTVYGIWDWDMNNWNNGQTTTNGVTIPAATQKYASLSEPQTISRSTLLSNSVTATGSASTRQMQVSTVCWAGSITCTPTSSNTQYGWFFDLPGTDEQVIYSPVFSAGALYLNTTIPPATATQTQCQPSTPTGWTMSFNMASGGGFTGNAFPNPSTGSLTPDSNGSIVGLQQSSVGTPFIVSVGTTQYIVSPNVTGGGVATVNQINPPGGVIIKRMTWEELR